MKALALFTALALFSATTLAQDAAPTVVPVEAPAVETTATEEPPVEVSPPPVAPIPAPVAAKPKPVVRQKKPSSPAKATKAEHKPDLAPQILSDLPQRQIVRVPLLDVDFFFVDQDQIKSVTINEEVQPITPASTLMISKQLLLTPGVTQVKVTAKDEAGNERTKIYLIGYNPSDQDTTNSWQIEYMAIVGTEVDSNPTADISAPFPIGDLDLQGVVDDNQQADSRTNVVGAVYARKGQFNLAGGIVNREYTKPDNSLYGAFAWFFSTGYWVPSGGDKLLFSYTFMDLNMGGADYQQLHSLGGMLLSKSRDAEGNYTSRIGLTQSMKSFAASNAVAGSETRFEWIYEAEESNEQDLFRSTFAVGQSQDAQEASLNQYISYSNLWRNAWESGLTAEFDWAFAMRNFPSDDALLPIGFGDTRLDLPVSLGTKIGYKFQKFWLKAHYSYLFNLSNSSVYERSITGVSLQGIF